MLTRKAYAHIPATYTPYPTATHRGNPLIEALPMRTWDLSELFIGLSHKPMPPDDKTRSLPSLIRSEETNTIRDILFHRPAYKAAARDIVSAIVEGYGHRNPLDSSDEVRRHQIGALNEDNVEHFRGLTDSQRLDRGWRGTASGCGLFGPTGSGKTSLLVALMWDWQVVICHTSYGGRPIHLKQIPVIRIQVPHDATLRTLCLMFFEEVDRALGQSLYAVQANNRTTIGFMSMLVFQVCTAISLGLLIVDDFQNLRAARSANVEVVLNLFSLLMEIAGVPLVVVGTPAAGELIKENSRNIRKLTSGGFTHLEMMGPKSLELAAFQDFYAPYQYTKHPVPLTDELRKAWNTAGAGNPAFLSLAFILAQRRAIGGNETLIAEHFHKSLQHDMALLRPAIEALNSGKLADLQQFEDLIFRHSLKQMLGISLPATRADNSELDGEQPPGVRAVRTRKTRAEPLSTEDSAKGAVSDAVGTGAEEAKKAWQRPAPLPTEDPTTLIDLR